MSAGDQTTRQAPSTRVSAAVVVYRQVVAAGDPLAGVAADPVPVADPVPAAVPVPEAVPVPVPDPPWAEPTAQVVVRVAVARSSCWASGVTDATVVVCWRAPSPLTAAAYAVFAVAPVVPCQGSEVRSPLVSPAARAAATGSGDGVDVHPAAPAARPRVRAAKSATRRVAPKRTRWDVIPTSSLTPLTTA